MLLLAALLSTAAIAGGTVTISPDAILEDIRDHGAKITVEKLTGGRHPQWHSVLRKIESGDSRWLAVTRQLAAGTDTGTSEGLQVILARALPKNPAGVLGVADSQPFFSIDDLCGAASVGRIAFIGESRQNATRCARRRAAMRALRHNANGFIIDS